MLWLPHREWWYSTVARLCVLLNANRPLDTVRGDATWTANYNVLVTGVVFDCPGNRECGWHWRRQFHYKQIRSYGGRLEGLKLL